MGGRAFLVGLPRPTAVAKGGWLGGAPRSPGAPTKLRILDKHNPLWRSSALPVPALGCDRKSGSERSCDERSSCKSQTLPDPGPNRNRNEDDSHRDARPPIPFVVSVSLRDYQEVFSQIPGTLPPRTRALPDGTTGVRTNRTSG